MRNHINSLLQIVDTSLLPVSFPSLTEDEVDEYLAGTLQCTVDNFRVDFVRKWKVFGFNKVARMVAIASFLRKVEGGSFLTNPSPEHLLTQDSIGKVIDVYMKRLRQLYRDAVNPPTQKKKDAIKRRACQVSRMGMVCYTPPVPDVSRLLRPFGQSYRDRRFVVLYLGEGRHRILFDRLSAANMSEDETDGDTVEHPPVYRIVIAEWQSEDFKLFLWALDALYRIHWKAPPTSRRKSGNPPRTWVLRDSCKTIRGTAAPGLWRNCYNKQWLNKLKPHELAELDIQEGIYDFSLDTATA